MDSKPNLQAYIVSLLIAAVMTTGCGGGGGGGSSTGATYTGSTSQATITTSNGTEIATTSYTNGSSATTIGGVVGAPLAPGASGRTGPTSANLADWAQQRIRFALDHQQSIPLLTKATQTASETVPGTCGGTATYSITAESTTGSFSGSFTFSDYCEDATTIDGTLTFSGTLDPITNDTFSTTTMIFTSLTVASAGESFTANGTLTTALSGSTFTVTSNLLLTNNATSATYKTENLILAVTDTGVSESVTLAGRFYHPEFGYVTLSTPTALVIADGDEYPSSGKLVATGANNGTVSITALSNTTYQIDVDANGDGTSESTTTGAWDA